MTKQMTRAQVLREFFFRPGKDTLQSFMEELKALTPEEKQDLAIMASEALGVELMKAA